MQPTDELLIGWRHLETLEGEHDTTLELPTKPLAAQTSAGPLRLALGSEGELRLLVPVTFRTRVPKDLGTVGLHVSETALSAGGALVKFLDVRCMDRGREKAFAGLAKDIVRRVDDGSGAVAAVQRAVEDFRRLLQKEKSQEVPLSAVVGLLGELLTLERLLEIDRTATDSWMTGAEARHDFARRLLAIESKAGLRKHERKVEISSLDQLEEPDDGRLWLSHHILEETSKGPVTVGVVACRLMERCEDPDSLRASLLAKDLDLGSTAPWDTRRFLVNEWGLYAVTSGFPRVVPAMLQEQLGEGVSHVKYTVNLDLAQEFRLEDANACLEEFLAR